MTEHTHHFVPRSTGNHHFELRCCTDNCNQTLAKYQAGQAEEEMEHEHEVR